MSSKADALIYLAEARKLADKLRDDFGSEAERQPIVLRVMLRSFLELAEESVMQIEELKRLRRVKKEKA